MDIIFEFLFEFIVEGSFELATCKKVPLIIRIVAGILVFGIYGGLIGVCFFFGVKDSSIVLIILGIFILLLSFLAIHKIFKEKRIR